MRTATALTLAICLLPCLALADVPAGTPFVESKALPVRVYYSGGAPQAQADSLLAEIEKAWAVEIVELGFATPLRVLDGAIVPGFHIHITKTAPSVGYTFEVLGDHPATPAADCAILGVVNKDYLKSQIYYQDAAWHVLNHAALHAVDCLERSVPTNDIFSIGLQHLRSEIPPGYFKLETETFQAFPEYPLDAMGRGSADMYYPFGAALFAVFLDQRYGLGDGRLLAEIWCRTAQPGHIVEVDTQNTELVTADVENDPTWFDAVDLTLADKGASLAAAYREFAVWRLLVGKYDDGKHYRDAARYAVPALSRTHVAADLPVSNLHPAKKVGNWGTSYVMLDPAGVPANQAVLVRFWGYKPHRWAAQAVCIRSGGEEARVLPLELDATNLGTRLVDPTGCQALVLVAENLSTDAYVPDNFDWGLEGDFIYSIALEPMPSLASATPAVVLAGTAPTITITGTRLSGPVLTASVSGGGIEVAAVERNSDTQVKLQLRVAADAVPGSREVSVVTGNGLVARGAGLLRVEVPPDAGAPGPDAASPGPDAGSTSADSGTVGLDASAPGPGADASAIAPLGSETGCGCSPVAGGPSLLALLGLGLLRRRR